MAEYTIQLIYNVKTGKKDILIDYLSDDDALPIEHEDRHREIVEMLVGKGLVEIEDLGQVKVGRVSPESVATTEEEQAPESTGLSETQ